VDLLTPLHPVKSRGAIRWGFSYTCHGSSVREIWKLPSPLTCITPALDLLLLRAGSALIVLQSVFGLDSFAVNYKPFLLYSLTIQSPQNCHRRGCNCMPAFILPLGIAQGVWPRATVCSLYLPVWLLFVMCVSSYVGCFGYWGLVVTKLLITKFPNHDKNNKSAGMSPWVRALEIQKIQQILNQQIIILQTHFK